MFTHNEETDAILTRIEEYRAKMAKINEVKKLILQTIGQMEETLYDTASPFVKGDYVKVSDREGGLIGYGFIKFVHYDSIEKTFTYGISKASSKGKVYKKSMDVVGYDLERSIKQGDMTIEKYTPIC